MTKPQEQRVKAGPNIGSQIEFFSVTTALDIQPGLITPLVLPADGVDASELEKETDGQKRLDLMVATVSNFAQPLMLKTKADGFTFAFEHVGAATAAKLKAALDAALVANGDVSDVVVAAI